ncbi:hypothetical protein KEM60_01756 [Austwickia sp. TVS 96-490-7B]|uniref:hypothetical protein n=1 Tax=Austwickia sp. TVS 96-490-7B TaxID=2830843 RepID=UPI001C5A112D|nr:hypothetical protein [Austwickia sp. TVS 96-490-7B]MBW3085556.1 hypothetical protein [Austwickia sp. TVS 96-490-7B]
MTSSKIKRPSFFSAIIGHFVIGVLMAVPQGLGFYFLSCYSGGPEVSSRDVAMALLIENLLVQPGSVWVERIVDNMAGRDQAGSWGKTCSLLVLTLAASGFSARLVFGDIATTSLYVVVSALACIIFMLFFGKPWLDGATMEDAERNWSETKALANEMFAEEIDFLRKGGRRQ